MKAYCQFCKSEGHWGSECPRLKSTTHGAPRVETKQLSSQPRSAYETTRVQRRPLAWGPKPTTPTELTERSLTSAIQATKPILEKLKARIAELEAEVKHLKHELANRVTEHPVAVTQTPVTPRNNSNTLSNAQKQAAYRARKKAKTHPSD